MLRSYTSCRPRRRVTKQEMAAVSGVGIGSSPGFEDRQGHGSNKHQLRAQRRQGHRDAGGANYRWWATRPWAPTAPELRGRDLVGAAGVGNDGDRVEGVEDWEVGEVTRQPLPLKDCGSSGGASSGSSIGKAGARQSAHAAAGMA